MKNSVFQKMKKYFMSHYTIKAVSVIVIVILMIFPFSMNRLDLTDPQSVGQPFYVLTILKANILEKNMNFFYINCLSLILLPIIAAVIVVSFFQKKINTKIVRLLSFIAVTIYLSACITGVILFANTPRWFHSLSIFTYVAFFTALIFHISLITYKIISIKIQNDAYVEYNNILVEEEKKQQDLHKQKLDKLKAKIKDPAESKEKVEKTKKLLKEYKKRIKHNKRKTHIKTKIMFVFLLTIIFILSIFIYTDLRNSKILFTQTINNTAKNQAEQVAAIYYYSDGLHAKISAFLDGIQKTNVSSPFPFKRIDIITTSNKETIFLEKIDENTKLPDYDIFSYTTEAGRVHTIPDEEKMITSEDASVYVQHFKNPKTKSEPIYKPEKGTAIYIHPITFARKEGQKLSGFSVITYYREILDRPYFQTKVFILSLSAIFLYASIIITLFLADFIANPIIALCGSIRKTANILAEMFSGNANIEASRLIFEQKVKTHDEVRNLSIEIKNIVSLVRGVLPYVSFHTLKNANKNINRQSVTRDVCFLFTDIRGFTTLCESLPPKDVIPILNHYLDLETKIIFDNGGDIDKYVGDEIMAFFAGPRKEIKACTAAMQIRKAMWEEQQTAIKEGKSVISIGIGINTGPVIFGSVGATTRKDFTSIGDTVNLAARLEGANKAYGSKAIISESVYEKLNDSFLCRELDYVTVKGKTEPVRIYEILQLKKASKEKLYDIKNLFEKGLANYRKKKWDVAEKYFTECNAKYKDIPSKVFLKRIEHYKQTPPPADWKGVFVMNVK